MNKIYKNFLLFVFLWSFLMLGGCARITETVKVMWGSSTKALEESRWQATSKTFACSLAACKEHIANIAREETLQVFMDNPKKKLMIVMGIPGSISTTEVGIFFSPVDSKKTKIEVTSLSLQAQETAAQIFFSHLKKVFSEVQ